MDTVLDKAIWAALVGMAIGAVLGGGVAAFGRRRRSEKAASRGVLTSFQYVLSDDPDAAIEELTRVAAVTPETIETYFALGALFRRKGDLSRASRIHQNIILRPGVDPALKRAAAFELGLDYRRGGLSARARAEFERVIAEEPSHRDAHRELRELLEEEGDWEGALARQASLESLGAGSSAVTAHLHAAHGRLLIARGRLDEAEHATRRALEADSGSADAHAARGELLLARGDLAGGLAAFSAAMRAHPEVIALVYPLLERAFEGGAQEGLGLFLGERLRENPEDPLLRLALARHLRRRGLSAEAAGELRRLLERHPTLLEARQELGQILLEGGTADELKAELAALLARIAHPQRPFACERCAVELGAHRFRCPRCFAWDSVRRLPAPVEPPADAPTPANSLEN